MSPRVKLRPPPGPEDARSMDMTTQHNQDRGFYTETFHSSAWLHRGDEVQLAPPPAKTEPRAAAIRERTVKISRGTGECPWGFRLQFSKPIVGAELGPDASLGKPFVIRCRPASGSRVYLLSAASGQDTRRYAGHTAGLCAPQEDVDAALLCSWLKALERAVQPITQSHVWMDVTRHNSLLPPLALKGPECLGPLQKYEPLKASWAPLYCVLKDGCLYLYAGLRAPAAYGGIYLQGYVAREQPYASRRSTVELRPPAEEFKAFYLCAESARENQRWVTAITASIDKWRPSRSACQQYLNQPPGETLLMHPLCPHGGPTEPGLYPTEPGLYPTEPGLHPTEPGLHPTEPGLYPTEPGLYPTEPGLYPTEPGL
ncbi:Splicing factor 3A subunit 2 [Liparis tanakae]|uniref:Splicing factor 3A subunit 2 n=1 Tax=Liparis tanakae TaxID=230148 RepID=A0A4Z2I359_9TELE|nr:Splicing factor 3A subunit 2 [Liparis tanakae]